MLSVCLSFLNVLVTPVRFPGPSSIGCDVPTVPFSFAVWVGDEHGQEGKVGGSF